MIALHEDHPVGKNDKGMKLKVAAQHVDAAMAHAHAHENKRANPVTTNERASKRRGELGRLWTPTQREVGIFVAQWLVGAGLPYNTVATEGFRLLVHQLTGDPSTTVLAASTFRDLLAALFTKFCEATKVLLLREPSDEVIH
ncbi:hypothetical protein DVH05_025610 [Phytophthora capsici]|nr:hypothetical protein DVH05_025610 [Phytophthora capsici]